MGAVSANYFAQFNVYELLGITVLYNKLSLTNSSMMILIAIMAIWLISGPDKLIPSRWGIVMNHISSHIRNIVHENLGYGGSVYYPLILSLFMMIALLNVLGLVPYVFTPTAHLAITFGLSLTIMTYVTVMGIIQFRFNYASIIVPRGIPLASAPFLVLIETVSYGVKAISLGLRLGANITAGHLLFAVLSSFAVELLFFGTGETLMLGILLFIIMLLIAILEFGVALIQAYVFSLLTTIYLSDTLHLH